MPEAHLEKAEDYMEAAAHTAEAHAAEKHAEIRKRIARAREHMSRK